MCSFTPSELTTPYNKPYVNKVFLIGTIVGILCLTSGSFVILLWAFIPEFVRLHRFAVKISAIMCVAGVIIVSVNTVCLYCRQCRVISNKKKRRKTLNTVKNGVHYFDGELYPENESFTTKYQLPAPSSLSMPEVFTTNGNLMRKTFVSLGSLELEKFEVVGVVHRTNSNLDVVGIDNGDKSVIGEKYKNSHPVSNLLSGKTFYFHSGNDDNNQDSTNITTGTTTNTDETTPISVTTTNNNNNVFNTNCLKKLYASARSIPYSLPRVSIREIQEIEPNLPVTSSHFVSVRRTRSDRIKHGKISRSILIPMGYSLDGPALSESNNSDHNNKPSISSIGFGVSNRRSSDNNNDNNNNKYRFLHSTEITTSHHKPSTDSEMSTFGNSVSHTIDTTSPIGQDSLFNLSANTVVTTHNNGSSSIDDKITEVDSNSTKQTPGVLPVKGKSVISSKHQLNKDDTDQERNDDGNCFVIMKSPNHQSQSHHVLSCTTLFNSDEDNPNNINDNSEGDNEIVSIDNGVSGFRRLQKIYSKWNVFPVCIENEKMAKYNNNSSVDKLSYDDDNNDNVEDGDESSEKRFSSRKTSTSTVAYNDKIRGSSILNPVRSLISRMKSHWANCHVNTKRSMKNRRIRHQKTKTRIKKRTKIKSISEETVHEFSSIHDSNKNDTILENDNDKYRRQTIITNASIFSLPAIPPALWNAERPVWIMGLPLNDDIDYDNNDHWFTVDTNKVILLKQESKLNNLPNSNITGSLSSIYAFHVRPPPRLKPVNIKSSRLHREIHQHQHTRAQSVGQMLISDKSILNIS
ncbi:unnamed protein product [Heterobilharzia americana]|nr:unnamed protein product [Heterobilharzia americana]